MTEGLPTDDAKLAAMQSLVESKIIENRQSNTVPPEAKPRSDTLDPSEFVKIAHRIRTAMATARKAVRAGGEIPKAKGYVICRIDNLMQYLRDHPDVTFVPYQARRDYFYGMSYVEITTHVEPIPAAREEKFDLRVLETMAHLPRGSAGYGSCMRCGRTLTDPHSVAQGIGPECIKKVPRRG